MNRAKKIMKKANARQTVANAAILISIAYLLSRLLGLLRDRLLIAEFGKGPLLDAYNAAFSVPDILFTLLVSGAFAVAFIPVFVSQLKQDRQDEAWEAASTLLNLLVIVTVVGAGIAALAADQLVYFTAPGFSQELHDLTVQLTRITLITPVLFAISSVLGSIQQAMNRFLIYALASVLYNLGIIVGIIFFADNFGIFGVAYGVVLGTVLQALLQWVGLWGLGYRYKLALNLKLKPVRRVLSLMGPRAIDQGVTQIGFVVEKAIASTLGVGTVTAFALASNLRNVPLSLIGAAIATAAFPRMSAQVAEGKKEQFADNIARTARLILFLSIPAAVMAVVARGYIVRLLYGFGDAQTANILGWFAGTIIFTSLFFLVARVFYVYQDTRTPLIVSIISISVNIVLAYLLAQRFGAVGLAMAASAVDAAETLILLAILRKRGIAIGMGRIIRGTWRMALAGTVMAAVLFVTIRYVVPLYAVDRGFLVVAPKFAVVLLAGAIGYILPSYLLRLSEVKLGYAKIRELIARPLGLQ